MSGLLTREIAPRTIDINTTSVPRPDSDQFATVEQWLGVQGSPPRCFIDVPSSTAQEGVEPVDLSNSLP